MKTIKLCSIALIATILFSLTSCLGDSNNTASHSMVAGVVVLEKGKVCVDTQIYGKIYDPNVETRLLALLDEYVVCTFEIETTSAENDNAEQNGYYYVSFYEVPAAITAGVTEYYSKPDTTSLMNNEIVLSEPFYAVSNYPFLIAYIDGVFFFPSQYTGVSDQKTQFIFYLDPNQTPEKNGLINEYSVILRAYRTDSGTSTTKQDYTQPNGYNVKLPIEMIQEKEKGSGNETFNLRFVYLSEIDEGENEEDEIQLVWTKDDAIVPFAIPTE